MQTETPPESGPRPKPPAHALGLALSAARTSAMAAWTLGSMYTALFHLDRRPPEQRPELLQRRMKLWARGLSTVFGVEQHRVTPEPASARGARLVVANHRSPLDIILMIEHFGGCVLSRSDLERWPVLGKAAYHGGTIFVDRDDPKSGVRAIREIRRRLNEGRTVIVFPEGTTHRGDEVHPFLGGAFSAVRGLGAEIVCAGIAYDPGAEFVDESFVEHIARVAQRRRTRVGLAFGTPWPAGADRAAMAERARSEVRALVARARAGLG
ncbi:MAG: 1-acyl-sn-glycerol-3-phosphate acyltransferase [Myxococcales bacterium]|nr:1-acyl-sn-glycerol-3-phosphate acyltransferase [Myxococcales bacterium]